MRARSGSKSIRIQCECSNPDWIWIVFGLKAQCEHAFSYSTICVVEHTYHKHCSQTRTAVLYSA